MYCFPVKKPVSSCRISLCFSRGLKHFLAGWVTQTASSLTAPRVQSGWVQSGPLNIRRDEVPLALRASRQILGKRVSGAVRKRVSKSSSSDFDLPAVSCSCLRLKTLKFQYVKLEGLTTLELFVFSKWVKMGSGKAAHYRSYRSFFFSSFPSGLNFKCAMEKQLIIGVPDLFVFM